MSAECRWAERLSRESTLRGLQPAFARSAFVSVTTCAAGPLRPGVGDGFGITGFGGAGLGMTGTSAGRYGGRPGTNSGSATGAPGRAGAEVGGVGGVDGGAASGAGGA